MYVTFSTVYILAIGRTSVKYEPTIDLHLYGSPRSPLYLCGGAWISAKSGVEFLVGNQIFSFSPARE